MRTRKLELVRSTELIAKETDRRSKTRFPIRRELRFKVLEGGKIVGSGAGNTRDMGSGGEAFFSDGDLKPGSFVELSISWPVLLDNRCPMRLIVFGRVLRSEGGWSTCSVDKYEFRTQARVYETSPAVRNDSMLQRWADSWLKESMKAAPANQHRVCRGPGVRAAATA